MDGKAKWFRSKAPEEWANLDPKRIPRHVAVIMDGNGRWATKRGLPRSMGHRAAMTALKNTIRMSSDLGMEALTLYAFSTENKKRPAQEVGFLMNLLVEFMAREIDELDENGVRIRIIGHYDELPEKVVACVGEAMERTKDNDGLKLSIALNYGSRLEIADGLKRFGKELLAGEICLEDVNEGTLGRYLDTAGLPDPDLVIRTSGELRISNFLLYQISYAELYFTDTLFPDFGEADYLEALQDYQKRNRRFGGVTEG
ncbi:isoprenyl transferase [Christensenellaceae bacterium NSJ-53]|uniref:Isoprenyl transferase n=2 Tax=Gehongia tenuis TaxID=2763655 RepID=A0A926D573_9FIRM|nr:isoprenyl transferase [Gehongia tenuis]